MIGAFAQRSVVLASEVNELPSDLETGQAVELAAGARGNMFQRFPQAKESILEDIVGILPAANTTELLEQPAGKEAQPLARLADQFGTRRLIPRVKAFDVNLQVIGPKGCLAHRCFFGVGRW